VASPNPVRSSSKATRPLWLNKFDEAVLTVVDSDGYPASLLCHSHEEKLWSLQMIELRGHVEKHQNVWTFVIDDFQPPSKLAFLSFIGGVRKSGKKYLERRGLERPPVNWAAIKEIERRAKRR
jgi:hypothetical protein